MRRQANEVPDYLKYGSYIIANNATPAETAANYGVTNKQVLDVINHSLKTNVPTMFAHVKNIHNTRKAQ